MHHFDFYRLPEPGVMAEQIAESINDENVLTIVEWSEIVKDVLPDNRLTIELKPRAVNPDERDIVITYPEKFAEQIRSLEQKWGRSEP